MLATSENYETTSRHSPHVRRVSPEAETRAMKAANNGRAAIDRRLEELDEEWSVEDLLKLQAVAFLAKYAIFGRVVNKKYYWVPVLVGAFTVQQAMTGWSPPFALYKKVGKRTKEEIDEERYALEYIRGDYD